MDEISTLIQSGPGAALVFGLIYVIVRLIERRVDAKTNGHFTAEDRRAVTTAILQLTEFRDEHKEHLEQTASLSDSLHDLVVELKLRNQTDASLAMQRSERDQALFRLMERNIELIQDIRVHKT